MQPRSGSNVFVRSEADGQFSFLIPILNFHEFLVHGDLQIRRRGAPDRRPGERCARWIGVDTGCRHLRPVHPRCRIGDDDPLDVVHTGCGFILSARFRRAIAAVIEPQVEIVQHRAGDGVGRRLVPGQHQVQAARAVGHVDVHPAVFAVLEFRNCAGAFPAAGLVLIENAGAGGHLAEPVLHLQLPRTCGIVGRVDIGVLHPGVGFDGAGHQARPGQRRPFAMCGSGIHQQCGHTSHCRRRHAGATEAVVTAAASIAGCRVEINAGADNLRRQPPIRRGAVAAEYRQTPAVERRADRQRVLRRAKVREAVNVRIRLCDHIELPSIPDDGVKLALRHVPPFPHASRSGQAHVHDERFGRLGRPSGLGTRGRLCQKVHAS